MYVVTIPQYKLNFVTTVNNIKTVATNLSVVIVRIKIKALFHLIQCPPKDINTHTTKGLTI